MTNPGKETEILVRAAIGRLGDSFRCEDAYRLLPNESCDSIRSVLRRLLYAGELKNYREGKKRVYTKTRCFMAELPREYDP